MKKCLEKYNEIWKKVSYSIKGEFNSGPTEKKISTKQCSQCIYTSVILIDSV